METSAKVSCRIAALGRAATPSLGPPRAAKEGWLLVMRRRGQSPPQKLNVAMPVGGGMEDGVGVEKYLFRAKSGF